jgi:hypothetical protein
MNTMSLSEHGLKSPDNKILNKDERQSTAWVHRQMAFSDDKKESIKTMSCIHLNLGSPAGEDIQEINLKLDMSDGSTIKTIQVT